jgi:hypothetical protein
MNTYDLAYQVLQNGFIPTNHPDFPLAPASAIPYQLYRELNDCMTQNFSRMVVNARAGYWLKSQTFTTTAGRSLYALPLRMATGGLERIEIAASSTDSFLPLAMETGTETVFWELANNGRGRPERFEMRGDQIALLPTPDTSSYVVRVWYYMRPSTMVTPQSIADRAPGYSPTERGVINSVNTSTRVITMSTLPLDMGASAAGSAIAAGRIDILRRSGWYEPVLLDLPITAIVGNTYTVGGTDDLSAIQTVAGGALSADLVRVANQTDWPMIPSDYHRSLADLATVSVLTQLHLLEKSAAYQSKISGDLQRFMELLQPRVKNQPAAVIPMQMPGMWASRGPRFRGGFP